MCPQQSGMSGGSTPTGNTAQDVKVDANTKIKPIRPGVVEVEQNGEKFEAEQLPDGRIIRGANRIIRGA